LVIGILPFWVNLRRRTAIQAALRGVNAAVVGLLLAALYDPICGITYPLYLLHMQMGYTILTAAAPVRNAELWTAAIVSGAVVLAWATWRFVERAVHRWTKNYMTAIAAKLGWKSRPKGAGSEITPA